MANIFNEFELLDFINLDEMMWEGEGGTIYYATLSDSITLSDGYSKTATFNRSYSDTVNLSDSHSRSISVFNADTITMSDTLVAFALVLLLYFNDTINMSDDISKSVEAVKSDTVNMSDSKYMTYGQFLSDSVNLSDLISKNMSTDRADSVSLTDAISKQIGMSNSDVISLIDSISKGIGLNVSDIINLSDVLATKIIEPFLTGWRSYTGTIAPIITGPFSIGAKSDFSVITKRKHFYNEGDYISSYENPVWTNPEGSTPITPTHIPCGYWTKKDISNIILKPLVSSDDGIWAADGPGSGTFLNWGNGLSIGRDERTSYKTTNHSFVRFPNAPLTRGSVLSCNLRLYQEGQNPRPTTVTLDIYFNFVADAVAPTNIGQWLGKDLTNAVSWTITFVAHPETGNYYESPDLSSILQEVIDLEHWESGNALLVLLMATSWTGALVPGEFFALDSPSVLTSELVISFSKI